MKRTLERETKLSVDRGFRLPDLPGEPIKPQSLTSTYFDTENHRLARSGITLRYRTEARAGVWQLKLPLNRARLELEFAGKPVGPPASLTGLLLAHTRGRPLKSLARLHTRRTGIRIVRDEGPLARSASKASGYGTRPNWRRLLSANRPRVSSARSRLFKTCWGSTRTPWCASNGSASCSGVREAS